MSTVHVDGVTFHAEKDSKGKKLQQVAGLLEVLAKYQGEPVPFEDACEDAGAKYPQDVQAGMMALEMAGLVERYVYTEDGSAKKKIAYALVKELPVNPRNASST